MRNYLIIVEGAHDIAVVEKLLDLNGVSQKVLSAADLCDVWKRTIPDRFPFIESRLDRITPIPSFMKNKEVSVAIKNANSDVEIMNTLQQILDAMLIGEKDQISGVMLLFDADSKKAESKLNDVLSSYEEKADFRIVKENGQQILDIGIKCVPVYTFVFPDNTKEGNLEDLLLETAKIAYPELLKLAEDYINEAAKLQKTLKKGQNVKKAKVGCIANTMKPGKANQVSIADDEWISEKTLQTCQTLQKLNYVIQQMIQT